LSYFLISKHQNEGYTATYKQIVDFTETYIQLNKRFVITVESLLAILIDKGVLRRNSVNRYTIRLTGVFEYFLAYFMKDDEGFRKGVIMDDHYYLSFSNELELCAGFVRRDESYIKMVFDKTKSIFNDIVCKYLDQPADKRLENSFNIDLSHPLEKLQRDIKAALPEESRDELIQSMEPVNQMADVSPKNFYDKIESNAANLEKALGILCRVFRNSSVLNDKLNDDILDYILDATCSMGFLIVDEYKVENKFEEDKEKLMVSILTSFMPLIVQTFLYDSLSQSNLERIILDKIAQLKQNDDRENQFKIFLLYFTLIDLDVKHYKDLLSELMASTKIGVLKQTILIKLYFYLLFSCTPNSSIEEFIKQKITEQTININNKADKALLQRNLAQMTSSKRATKIK